MEVARSTNGYRTVIAMKTNQVTSKISLELERTTAVSAFELWIDVALIAQVSR